MCVQHGLAVTRMLELLVGQEGLNFRARIGGMIWQEKM